MCIDPTPAELVSRSSLVMGTDGFFLFLFFLSSLFTFLIFGDRMSLGSSDWPGNSAAQPILESSSFVLLHLNYWDRGPQAQSGRFFLHRDKSMGALILHSVFCEPKAALKRASQENK